jgi:hypothetical protein
MMAPAVALEQAEPFFPAALNDLGTKWGRPVVVRITILDEGSPVAADSLELTPLPLVTDGATAPAGSPRARRPGIATSDPIANFDVKRIVTAP